MPIDGPDPEGSPGACELVRNSFDIQNRTAIVQVQTEISESSKGEILLLLLIDLIERIELWLPDIL